MDLQNNSGMSTSSVNHKTGYWLESLLKTMGVVPADIFELLLNNWVIPIFNIIGGITTIVTLCVLLRMNVKKNIYLISLSISDTFCLCLMFIQWNNKMENSKDCQINRIFRNFATFCSEWFIVAFTVERFVAVKYPLACRIRCTAFRSKFVIPFLMTSGFLISVPYWMLSIRYKHKEFMTSLNIFELIITYALPFSVTTILNFYICSIVWKSEKQRGTLNMHDNFYQKFGIKGTIGALDCTHVGIITPSSSDTENPVSLYMNRKTFYSVNVEAICDHRMIFTSINAKFPGSCHDSGIWTTSPARVWLLSNHCPYQSSWLLGDKGYPLEPWLFTPFLAPHTAKERKYNKIHAKARNTIERAFGVLKGRFKCLSKERILYYSHERAANIIYACAILHNILIKNGIVLDPSEEEIDDVFDVPDTAPPHAATTSATSFFREGTRLRASYVSTLQTRPRR